ncbi:MAG: hypothetical protein WCP96_09940 [Methylococcaceae bacterium]
MSEPAHFIKTFVADLNAAIGELKPNAKLTQLQRVWAGLLFNRNIADKLGVLGKVRACELNLIAIETEQALVSQMLIDLREQLMAVLPDFCQHLG